MKQSAQSALRAVVRHAHFPVALFFAIFATCSAAQTFPPRVPALSLSDVSVVEGDSGQQQVYFTAELSHPADQDVSFDFATANGTATQGVDYQADAGSSVILQGTTSIEIKVQVNGDTAIEPNETFTLSLQSVVGATLANGTATATILDDDLRSPPTFAIGDVSIAEGNRGTRQMTFTATLSAASTWPVTFDIATADGSATSGSDYAGTILPGLVIAPGQVSKTFSVAINGDVSVESDETFTVTASNMVGAIVGDGQAIGTIANDDSSSSTPALSIDDVTILEGDSGTKTMVFTVELSAAAAGPVTFDIATANGSATAGSDYVSSSLVGQTIAAGATSKTFSVTINGDATVEQSETFTVNLSNPSGASIFDSQAIGTIGNDDFLSGAYLSIGDASKAEGNAGTSTMTFTVTLLYAPTSPVTFDIATANGTATAGSDYVASTQAGVSMAPGETSKTFSVTINGDATVEPNETFTVSMSNVTGATLADGQAIGTIVNDDVAPITIARLVTGGLVDDIDDGHGEAVLSMGEYALLLNDAAHQVCARAGGPTIVGVDGVESLSVLQDLAETANALCASKPHYAAVFKAGGGSDGLGFLVDMKSSYGLAVEALQLLDTVPVRGARNRAKVATRARAPVLVSLTLPGTAGSERMSVLLVPEASGSVKSKLQAQADMATRVRTQLVADPSQPLVLLGGMGANQFDGKLSELGADLRQKAGTRVLVNAALLRSYHTAKVGTPTPGAPMVEKVLQLR